jgi:calcium/calmodulin-dependent 3',5'-cyclic nucleotide phosphodiesterase
MEKELGLAYSPLCDRNSTLIPQSQIGKLSQHLEPSSFTYCLPLSGFIDFIVAPTMELCGDLIERVHENINSQQQQSDVPESSSDREVTNIATEAKSQTRSQSSMEATRNVEAQEGASSKQIATTHTNGSGPSAPHGTRYVCTSPTRSVPTEVAN